jgi:hypothetical protein
MMTKRRRNENMNTDNTNQDNDGTGEPAGTESNNKPLASASQVKGGTSPTGSAGKATPV